MDDWPVLYLINELFSGMGKRTGGMLGEELYTIQDKF